MRHHNSIFHGLLKHVPWAGFARLVDRHQADHRVRRLSTKSQFVAMLFGQLAGSYPGFGLIANHAKTSAG